MKRKIVISVLITILTFVFAVALLTACNDETTLDNLNNEYGASIEGGAFPEGSTLITTVVDETSDEGKAAVDAIKGYDYNVFKPVYIFDISVVKDDATVQPNGKVKVTIPVDTSLVSYRVVFHIKDSGEVEKLSASYQGGKISFETDSFSIFVLAEPTMINHLHTFSDEWSFDETKHWHAATCEHYSEKGDLGEHAWDEGEITTPATEEVDGVITYTCTVCGHKKTEPVKYHEHTFGYEWSQSKTHHWHDCISEDCDAVDCYEEHYYDSHAWWEVLKEATETEEGDMIRICIGCKYEDHHVIPKYDPEHEHTYEEEWSSNAGYHWHYATCVHINLYGDEAEHDWDKGVITKPVTDEDGIMTYTCTVCGATREEPIPHEHTFSADWSKDKTHHWHAATCAHTTEIDGKAEHTWNDGVITTPATAEKDGVRTYTCTVCDETKEEPVEYVAHDHTFSSYWSKDDNYHWHACTSGDDCTEIADKAEHTWGEPNVRRENSSVEGGLTEYTCTVCGKIKQVKTPHEHVYGDWQFSPTSHWQIANCGYYTGHNGIRGPQSAHEYVDGFCKDCGIKDPSVASVGLAFTLQDDDTYYVSGIGTCTDVHIVVPSVYEGKAVTGIAPSAFLYKTTLRSVYLPDSVKTIGDSAFEDCIQLSSVRFPDEMTSIGVKAFLSCNLYTLTLPTKGLSEIKAEAFAQNYVYLNSIYIPDNIKVIGAGAFYYCAAVEELRLPETIESLGVGSFKDLRALTSVTIPKGIIELPESVFENCHSLTEVDIPDWIETIGEEAFYGCKNLTTVHFTSNLKSIEQYAFRSTKLASVTIPSSITEIKGWVFADCASLSEVVLHEGITTIGDSAFYGSKSLSGITLPSGLTSLGTNAFYESGLTSIVVPEKITVINYATFSNCKKLTSVTLPEGLLKIDSYAFNRCEALKEISIPNGVTEILADAFSACSALTTVNIPTSLTEISSATFYATKIKNIVIPDSVIAISSQAFAVNSELESVTFGKNVKSIGYGVFEKCSGLVTVNLPSSLESIGTSAFQDCTNLTTISIPSEIKDVGQAFEGCDKLQYTEYDNAYYLGNDSNPYVVLAKVKDKTATSCTIHSNARVIAGSAFYEAAITSINITDNIKAIGSCAFYYSKLTDVTLASIDDWYESYVSGEYCYKLAKFNENKWSSSGKDATSETRAQILKSSNSYFREGYIPYGLTISETK